MKNISKGKVSIYFFNAYSNLNPKIHFISGSDRVGINLIEKENSEVIVIAPEIFKPLLKNNVIFYSSDSYSFKNLFLKYILRIFKTILIVNKIQKEKIISKVVSTSDFFPDVIPSFFLSFGTSWYSFTYHLYPLKLNFRDLVGRVLQIFSYLLFKKSVKVVTCSSECEDFLKKKFRIQNVLRIPLGIDLGMYLNSESKNSEIIYLGRIKNSKGVFDLPEIISYVKTAYPKIKLKIIGNGTESDVSKLIKLIKNFDVIENIEILHNLTDKEVILQLQKSSILAQTSYEEGFGLSVLEALAAGNRVVLYDLPVYKEHFGNFELNYVKLGNKSEFATQIIKTLTTNNKVSYPIEKFEIYSWKAIFSKVFMD